MSIAEVSSVRIENANDLVKPFVCSFHVRVPGYAQRTGKRLFFQPAFFQYGKSPRFSATERKYDVRIGITKDQRMLVYRRDFLFGDGGRILFPTGSYQQLKHILDVTHELDNRIITLKQAEANSKN